MKIENKIKLIVEVFVLFAIVILMASNFAIDSRVFANEQNDTEILIDEISIDNEDMDDIQEGITFFNAMLEDQEKNMNTRVIGDERLRVTPLSGEFIKFSFLKNDLFESIANGQKIDLSIEDTIYESLTENGQVATFAELDGEIILESVLLTPNNQLSVDTIYLTQLANEADLQLDNVYYLRTIHVRGLTFAYFPNSEKIVPFYNKSDATYHIEGIKNREVYSISQLEESVSNYLTELKNTEVVDENGDLIVGSPSRLISHTDKQFAVIPYLVAVLSSILVFVSAHLMSTHKKARMKINK